MTTIAKKLAQIKPGTLEPVRVPCWQAWIWASTASLRLFLPAADRLDGNGQRVDRFLATQSRQGYEYLRERLQGVTRRQGACGVLVGMEPTNLSDARQATTGSKSAPSSAKSGSRFAWSTLSPSTAIVRETSWIEPRTTGGTRS
ncbi:MAG: hypothetical protein NTU91_01070 [Chloroflexi bacterium]|nr:hypothetical protein [Chloroflexota bacterium]